MKKKFYMGIRGIEFIYHNDYTDPELRYKGRLYYYYDFEEMLMNDHKESESELSFEDWVAQNHENAICMIEESSPKIIASDGYVGVCAIDSLNDKILLKNGRWKSIKYTKTGAPYFNKDGKRYRLSDFLKVG